jgi:O-antigen/teichoic acid export membrane protein
MPTAVAPGPGDTLSSSSWLKWVRKGVLAATDQGLISGANFVSTILLARWMGPQQYGGYVLAFSVYLLVSAVYQALVLEPMSVLGPVLYRDTHKPYIRSLLRVHVYLSIILCMAIAATAAVANIMSANAEFVIALYGVAAGAPFVLLLALLRSACYLRFEVRTAAVAAGIYAMLFVAGLFGVHQLSGLSSFGVFALMGITSLAVSVVLIPYVIGGTCTADKESVPIRAVCREHWCYGRWALGTGGVNWVWENSWYIVCGLLLTMREVGGLRSSGNLLLPVAHLVAACGRLAQPFVSSIAGRAGAQATVAPVRRIGLLFTAASALYCIVISAFGQQIFKVLYGPEFAPFAALFPWIGFNYVLVIASNNGSAIGLRALQSPVSVFTAQAAGGIIAVLLSIPAGYMYRLTGIVAASIVASTVSFILTVYLFHAKVSSSAPEPVIVRR